MPAMRCCRMAAGSETHIYAARRQCTEHPWRNCAGGAPSTAPMHVRAGWQACGNNTRCSSRWQHEVAARGAATGGHPRQQQPSQRKRHQRVSPPPQNHTSAHLAQPCAGRAPECARWSGCARGTGSAGAAAAARWPAATRAAGRNGTAPSPRWAAACLGVPEAWARRTAGRQTKDSKPPVTSQAEEGQ